MYICVCNALNDKEVARAARGDGGCEPARAVADVFRRCGRKPQCGKCLGDVAKIIEQENADPSYARLAAE